MAENFLGQIEEYDNNNEASLSPVDKTQHCIKNSYGKVIHTSFLVGNPRPNTPAIIMEADCQASEEVAFTTNSFDSKENIPLGGGGLQNPINGKIQVLALEDSVEINAGTSQIKLLENGDITITKDTTTIIISNTINIKVSETSVAELTQSAINFLVPVNLPAGSKVNGKLVAVVGGDIDTTSKKIISSGQ